MDLTYFEQWVLKEYNIDLSAYKSNQLHRRILSLMSRVGANSVEEYITLLKKQPEQKVFSDTRSLEGKTKAKNKSSWDQFTTKIEEKISHKSKVLTEDKSKTFGILLLSFLVPFYVASHIFQPFIFKIFPFLNIACPILIVIGIYLAFFKS